MANKNVVQDVLPPKKSIRNVKLSERGSDISVSATRKTAPRPTRSEPKPDIVVEDFTRPVAIKTEAPQRVESTFVNNRPPVTPVNSYKYDFDEPKKSSRKVLYVSLLALVVLLGFGVSAFFKSAKITIIPKNQVVSVNDVFSAKKDISSGGLGFQVVTVAKDVEKSVDSTGESMVQKKATGSIIIYNSFSAQSQKLVATTRFQTTEGLIYRLISPVTVPGTSVKAGKTVAGSVEALVEADKVGADYNIGLKDFTIPGLKGDPKYSKIYGRSKTEMTGGFSGMQKTVSKDVIDKSNNELEDSLKSYLSKDITSQIPSDFVLYATSLSYNFEPVTQTNSSTGGAVLKKKGTATAIIFDKGLLSRAILAKLLPESVNDVVKITNLEELDFTYATDTPSVTNGSNSVSFMLKGEPHFVWVVDEGKIKSELLSLNRKDAQKILAKYSNIKEAWVETRPFWNQTIPSDTNKVTLINTLTK